MSEDKKSEQKKVDWVLPKGHGVDVSNISVNKLNDLSEGRNLNFEPRDNKNTVNITETVVKDMPAPREKSEREKTKNE